MVKKLEKSNKFKKLKAVDPFYAGERKVLLDKGLINANQAPKEDHAKLPSKMREILAVNEKIKQSRHLLKTDLKDKVARQRDTKRNGNNNKKISKARVEQTMLNQMMNMRSDDQTATVPLRPVKQLVKSVQETDKQFMQRLDKHAEGVIKRSQYEAQFDVKLETKDDKVIVNKEKGMSKRKRVKLDVLKAKLKHKKNARQIERDAKNEKARGARPKFGDTNDAPPAITARPRLPKNMLAVPKVALTIPVDRPGKRGVNESDRNVAIQRYRLMKSQGKFRMQT